jgi:hypothetical protein
VLRRYEPLDWPIAATGARERDFGTLRIAVWGLVQQTGVFDATVSNRGATPITVDYLELEADGEIQRWAPLPGYPREIPPAGEVDVRASFQPTDDDEPRLLIATSAGQISIELELP